MHEYKPNSHKYKQERQEKESNEKKEIAKVVKGNVKTRKKNTIQKMTSSIISEDTENVKTYILVDVLLPTVKKAISDIITGGTDMLLFGERGKSSKKSSSSRISYRSYYDDEPRRRSSRDHIRARNDFDFDDIVFDRRDDALEVLDRLCECIDRYEFASVADLYDSVGISCNHTFNKYGWSNLRDAEVVRVRDGYVIKFPRVRPID